MRRVDPAVAREQAAAGWLGDSADDRVLLLDALAEGLGLDDVPFLESVLSDRSAAVSARAATLLARLCARLPLDEQPPFGRRAMDRARPAVRLVRQGLLRSTVLEVVAPEALDENARRDGIAEHRRAPEGTARLVAGADHRPGAAVVVGERVPAVTR